MNLIESAKQYVLENQSDEKPSSPPQRVTEVNSEAYPKFEVQVGNVLFSINSAEAAIYFPSSEAMKRLVLEEQTPAPNELIKQSVSVSAPTPETAEQSRQLINSAFGIAAILHSIEENKLVTSGYSEHAVYAKDKEGRSFIYDFRPEYQQGRQSIVRFVEAEHPTILDSAADVVPAVTCVPYLIENMSSQLSIAVKAGLSIESNITTELSEGKKLEAKFNKILREAFPDLHSHIGLHELPDQIKVSMSIKGKDFALEESCVIANGEIQEEKSQKHGGKNIPTETINKSQHIWNSFCSDVSQYEMMQSFFNDIL